MDNRKTGYYPCLAIIFSCLKNYIQVGEPVPQPLPSNIRELKNHDEVHDDDVC